MAGIAFKLRRYTEEESYFGILKGYTYSAILVAGPWLVSAVALGMLAFISEGEMQLVHAIIMYVFCFSLIYVGIFQFVVTRFLADKLYSGDIKFQIPTFMGALLLILAPQALLGGLFLTTLEVPFLFRLVAFVTYLVISAIWTTLLFLGILRAYQWAVLSFIVGGGVSLVAGISLGRLSNQIGILSGFLIGQVVILAILIWLILSEFPWEKTIDFSFLSYFRLYPFLSVLGVFYYLSIWVDKFIYRASPMGTLMAPKFLYAAPSYELSAFIAQLTIIPALAIFFLLVETNFYERYREFSAAIVQHQSFSVIESCKNSLLYSTREGFFTILKFQGLITGVLVLLAPQIFRPLWLDATRLEILRVLLLGTFFQTLLFLTVILMLYLELYRPALVSCTLFLISNSVFTTVFLYVLPQTAGWGFALSALGAFMYAAWSLMASLERLPEITFMRKLEPSAHIVSNPSLYHEGGIALYHHGSSWKGKI